jgi:hypothetical protein
MNILSVAKNLMEAPVDKSIFYHAAKTEYALSIA